MASTPILLALAAGVMSGSYALCLRLAAGSINPALGALIVAATALLFSFCVFIFPRGVASAASLRGASLMIIAGVAAAGTNIFLMLAYARGFKLSSSPVATATQMSLVLLVGVV